MRCWDDRGRLNIEMIFNEHAKAVDVIAIDSRLEDLRGEMAALMKLKLTAGIDNEIYGEEYDRITAEMDELKSSRSVFGQAVGVRLETIGQGREIGKVLGNVVKELFGILVERIKGINLVQVKFVLRASIEVIELL